jgi:hypothetical protein
MLEPAVQKLEQDLEVISGQDGVGSLEEILGSSMCAGVLAL